MKSRKEHKFFLCVHERFKESKDKDKQTFEELLYFGGNSRRFSCEAVDKSVEEDA
jgi:hypothetical protein